MGSDWVCTRCKTENEAWRGWCKRCTHSRSDVPIPQPAPTGAPGPNAGGRGGAGGPRTGVIVVVVIAVLAAALGAFALTRGDDSKPEAATSSSSSSAATTTTLNSVRTAEQVAADEATAQSIQLNAADLAGFSPEANDVGPALSPLRIKSDGDFIPCFGDPPAAPTDAPTELASDDFFDEGRRRVLGEVTIYANDRLAKDDFELVKSSAATTCLGGLLNKITQEDLAGRSLPKDVHVGDAVVSVLHLGNVHGDDVIVLRGVVPVQAFQLSARDQHDLVFVRKGRTTVTLLFDTSVDAFAIDFELAVVNGVVDRMPAS